MPAPATFIPLDFPARGIDRSLPFARQPVGTTWHARNVVMLPPQSGRYGMGRRPALARATDSPLGESGARQVNGLGILPVSTSNPQLGSGFYSTVSEGFTQAIVQTDNTTPSELGTDPTIAGSRQDLAGFHLDAANSRATINYGYQVKQNDLTGTDGEPLENNDAGGLVIDFDGTNWPGLCVLGDCLPDATVTLFASGEATADHNETGNEGESTWFGPFINAAADLSSFWVALLVRDSADTIQLQLRRFSAGTLTAIAGYTPASLSGDAWDATTQARPGPAIRIWRSSTDTVSATCVWAAEGIGTTKPRLMVSVTDATFSAQNRVGCIGVPFVGTADAVANRWYVKSFEYTRIVPRPPIEKFALNRFSKQNPTPARYWVPSDWTSYGLTTAGVLSTFTGSSSSAPLPGRAYIDNVTRLLIGNTAANTSTFLLPTTAPTERYQVEVRGRRDAAGGIDGTGGAAVEDIPGAALRFTADRMNGLLIEVLHAADTADYFPGRADTFSTIRFVGIAAGARYVLATYTPADTSLPPFRADTWQRFEDDGAAMASMTVVWKVNGGAVKTFTPSSMAGWAAFAAAIAPARLAEMNTSVLAGICFAGASATPAAYAFGGRLVDPSPELETDQSVAETESLIAGFTSGYVDIISLADAKPRRCDGAGHYNPVVQVATFNGRFYSVDGSTSKVTDPLGLTTEAWLADEADGGNPLGEVPTGMRGIAAWRGRPVLFNSIADPTIYYLGRSLEWGDFDYNADPFETAAIAGNNGEVGQPAEPITAGFGYDRDYFIFGTHRSMYWLVGDPGIGGQLQVLSKATGILGPRAWTIDDAGVVWVLGSAGLYRFLPGVSPPEHVSARRMGAMLDGLDASDVFVQLAFRHADRTLHIYRTPRVKSDPAVHIVYSLATDAFTEAVFDQDGAEPGMNPWSVAVADASDPALRDIYLGAYDGYLRRFDATLAADQGDGEDLTIAAELDIPVLPFGAMTAEAMAEQVHIIPTVGSSAIAARWFTSDSPERLAASTNGTEVAGWTIAAGGGYQRPVSLRRRAACHMLRLAIAAAGADFAIEQMQLSVSPRGRRR